MRRNEKPFEREVLPPGLGVSLMQIRAAALVGLVGVGLACAHPDSVDRGPTTANEPEIQPSVEGSASETEVDWSETRERRRKERLARGEVAIVTFDGEFVAGGLPAKTTKAIPVGGIDLSFLLGFNVSRILEGKFPDGSTRDVTFAVHSPAMLFGFHGIPVAENEHIPVGRFKLTLWQSSTGIYDLDVEPLSSER